MTTRSDMRWSESHLRDFRARNGRWAKGTMHTDVVAGPACRATVPTITAASEGTRSREVRGGVVPVPCTSEAAPIYERDVLAGVLKALALHPRVAWATRLNVGAFTNAAGQHVRVGFRGCSDIIGQITDGAFLACEVKRPGAKPTLDQAAFLARVRAAGGVAFVAWSIDDVARGLATGPRAA